MDKRVHLWIKRVFDIGLSMVGLLLLAVPFAIIALAIKLDSKGPVFFRQERVGKDGRSFKVWKFRTMVVEAEHMRARYGFEKDDPRITRMGKILRMTGVDELPQLINVLKGDMSLVGPRPTLLYQVDMYNARQRERLRVKPGITGWALIHGRNELKWSKRIEYDLWYIENSSLWLDLKILFKTLKVVALREGLRMDQSVEEIEDFHQTEE
jgi:exopolysaccharide biosynthesis polyprenyl glycosylphosphotransferase